MGLVSTTTVGDATTRTLGRSLVEQPLAGRQIGASTTDGADEIARQPGTGLRERT